MLIISSRESCHVISTSLPCLHHVNEPIHVIGLAFSAYSGIFFFNYVDQNDIFVNMLSFRSSFSWAATIIFLILHFHILKLWLVTHEGVFFIFHILALIFNVFMHY